MSSSLNDEQIIALLEQLFTNMNNLDRIYYDMFINTTPMDITLERYNQDGVIETFVLPNRAKDRQNVLQGRGTPEGAQIASIGTLYFDLLTNNIYVKISEGGASGWVLLRTSTNFLPGEDYLTPTGSASHLTDISASSLDGGILDVRVGGTGNTSLSGILKGNGENPVITAKPSIDYMVPRTHIGMLGLFPGEIDKLPLGWLVCNGSFVNKTDYPALYQAIGDIYLYEGTEWDRTTDPSYNTNKMALPDYRGYYIRGWKSANTSNKTLRIGEHEKSAAPNIKGIGGIGWTNKYENDTNRIGKTQITGAYYIIQSPDKTTQYVGVSDTAVGTNDPTVGFNANLYNNIYQDNMPEIRVDGIYTLICIYAGVMGESYSEQ